MAAGGGGDAVGALLARRALGDTDERPPLVTTCAWERLRIDPVPGPRARTDFTGLGLVGGEPCEVLPTSGTTPPGRSVLPRLAETSGARIFLHDFDGGAIGLREQLQRLATSLDAEKLVVVDVGGDIVARGPEPGLRSPLADSITLAAALGTHIRTSLVVLGPGADAELQEGAVLNLLREAGASRAGLVAPDDVKGLGPVLFWHPTEASAVVAAAAEGMRGAVAMRRGRAATPVTDHTAEIWVLDRPTEESFPLVWALQGTTDLREAESAMRSLAVNEIDLERQFAERHTPLQTSISLTQLISEMKAVGATHITRRRASERTDPEALSQGSMNHGPEYAGLWSERELALLAGSSNKGSTHG